MSDNSTQKFIRLHCICQNNKPESIVSDNSIRLHCMCQNNKPESIVSDNSTRKVYSFMCQEKQTWHPLFDCLGSKHLKNLFNPVLGKWKTSFHLQFLIIHVICGI